MTAAEVLPMMMLAGAYTIRPVEHIVMVKMVISAFYNDKLP
jgi:hypothetical protein